MKDARSILEFDQVKKNLSNYAILSFTKEKIRNLDYSVDYYWVKEELEKTHEALNIVASFGRCPIEYIHDLSESIDKAAKLGVLHPEELYRIATQVDGIVRMKSFYNALKSEQYPNFEYYINTLHPLKDLKERINKCITPNFDIFDNASSTLSKIRRDLVTKSLEIRHKLDAIVRSKATYLSENLVTMRNDRLVIPVKSVYKNTVNGIIHDESATQQTVYVEPESVILLNSQVASLKQQENIEIERILRELTKLVASNSDILLRNQKMIEEIDYMFAKGCYGNELNAMIPTIVEEPIVYLKGARHPLIDQKIVVANDFSLGGEDKRIYLITGPNTGGKTVALKTVGILALMTQCGLAIPVDFEAKLGIFEDFYADIGDEQSIEQSLSTFSSHMQKLTEMVEKVNDKSLVLIDEVGGGTDPTEGEAIAMAVLNYFHEAGAIVLSTTHYANLKSFAIEGGYINNASMVFDSEQMRPTYKLAKGVSGKSYAFEIATNLGFPNKLVDSARDYRKHYMTRSDELIEQLENELTIINKQKEVIAKDKQSAQEELEKIKLERSALVLEKAKIKENAQEEIDKLVVDAMQSVEDVLIDLKKNENLKLHEVIAAKTKIKSLQKDDADEETIINNNSFNVGDYVVVISANRRGKIERINGEEYLVNIGGISLKVKKSNIKHSIEKSMEKVQQKVLHTEAILHVPAELNMIGLHVEEARAELDKYIDNAIRVHMKSVRVIHGFGSGALRNMVQTYLKGNKYVKEFHYGGAYDGGMGATVVTFKD